MSDEQKKKLEGIRKKKQQQEKPASKPDLNTMILAQQILQGTQALQSQAGPSNFMQPQVGTSNFLQPQAGPSNYLQSQAGPSTFLTLAAANGKARNQGNPKRTGGRNIDKSASQYFGCQGFGHWNGDYDCPLIIKKNKEEDDKK